MTTHTMKRGDRFPPLIATLNHEGGGAVDLTGATVRFIMKRQRGEVIADRELPGVAIEGATVTVEWQAGETDAAGIYRTELEVTFPSGRQATWPNDGYALVHIVEDLGGVA